VPRQKLRTAALRDEVLRQALDVLEVDGPAAVRARQVASRAGTSTASVYELFGDKAGLVRAMFSEAFRALLERLEAVDEGEDALAHLTALLATSRRFGIEHPMLFDLMYGRPFHEFSPTSSDLAVGARIYDLVLGAVRRWLEDARSRTDPLDAAHALIALDRGLVAAELAGVLGRSRERRDRRWHLAVRAQLDGLAR
jgi:AcrR family transcriptional regulator